jgi:hypothetical protein
MANLPSIFSSTFKKGFRRVQSQIIIKEIIQIRDYWCGLGLFYKVISNTELKLLTYNDTGIILLTYQWTFLVYKAVCYNHFFFLYCTTLETFFLYANETSALKSKNNLLRKRQLRLGNLEMYFNNNDLNEPSDPALIYIYTLHLNQDFHFFQALFSFKEYETS